MAVELVEIDLFWCVVENGEIDLFWWGVYGNPLTSHPNELLSGVVFLFPIGF